MESIGSYLFWASIYMIVTAMVYFFTVRQSATPAQARWFILAGMFLSLLIPVYVFIPVNAAGTAFAIPGNMVPEVVVGASESINSTHQEVIRTIGTQRLLVSGIIVVTMILLLRMLISIIYLAYQIKRSSVMHADGYKIIPFKHDFSPYSFFSYVFVPQKLLHQEQLHPILLHEQGHIRKFHTVDLILIELISVVFWFNPATWYLRKALKHQHEYEADQYVLQKKFDKINYQRLLVNVCMHGFAVPVTTPFNYPPIKQRIVMMNKNFSMLRVRAILSMITAIPFFCAVFFMQACTASDDHLANDEGAVYESIAEETIADDQFFDDVIFTVVQEPPRFPGGEQARVQFMQQHLRYPDKARAAGIQGTVFVSFVVRYDGTITDVKVLRGIGGGCDEEAVRVVSMMPNWDPGSQRGKLVSVQFNMPIRFKLDTETKETDLETTGESYFYLDGKLYPVNDADLVIDNLITPDEIESIDVITGEHALERFGKERVLLLNRKKEF